MKRISAITTVCTFLICWSSIGLSQESSLWHALSNEQESIKVNEQKKTREGRKIRLDFEKFRAQLFAISGKQEVVVDLPLPNGQNEEFSIKYAPVMAEGLAKKYPAIRSFAGKGVDDLSANVRLDISHKGVHVMISSGTTPMVLIDPL